MMAGTRWARWARELALVAGLYAAYMAARALIGVHIDDAEARGADILGLEAAFALDIERPLNALLTAIPPLALLAAYIYATLHYVATPATLVWMAARRRGAYAVERNALLIATAIGLLGYWLLPTAPPRLVGAGLTDTMAAFSDLGWWGGAASAPRGMESLSNQYAAMPSLHVGWAVWVAACLGAHARSRLVRRWAWTYPVVMALGDGHRQPLPARRGRRDRMRRARCADRPITCRPPGYHQPRRKHMSHLDALTGQLLVGALTPRPRATRSSSRASTYAATTARSSTTSLSGSAAAQSPGCSVPAAGRPP